MSLLAARRPLPVRLKAPPPPEGQEGQTCPGWSSRTLRVPGTQTIFESSVADERELGRPPTPGRSYSSGMSNIDLRRLAIAADGPRAPRPASARMQRRQSAARPDCTAKRRQSGGRLLRRGGDGPERSARSSTARFFSTPTRRNSTANFRSCSNRQNVRSEAWLLRSQGLRQTRGPFHLPDGSYISCGRRRLWRAGREASGTSGSHSAITDWL